MSLFYSTQIKAAIVMAILLHLSKSKIKTHFHMNFDITS